MARGFNPFLLRNNFVGFLKSLWLCPLGYICIVQYLLNFLLQNKSNSGRNWDMRSPFRGVEGRVFLVNAHISVSSPLIHIET